MMLWENMHVTNNTFTQVGFMPLYDSKILYLNTETLGGSKPKFPSYGQL